MEYIRAIAWSPNGRWLASAGEANQIQIWDIVQQRIIKTLKTKKYKISSLSWSPDNSYLACGQGHWRDLDQGQIQVWHSTTGESAWQSEETSYGVYSVSFSPNGHWLASGHGSGVTKVWHAASGRRYIKASVRKDVRNLINGINFSYDSRYIACGTCYENGLYVYTIHGQIVHEIIFPAQSSWVDYEHVVCFSPDNKWVARGSQEGQVSLWQREAPLLSVDFLGQGAPTYAIAWSPSGQYLASGSRLGEIIIWAVSSKEIVCTLRQRPIHTLCYSPDGQLLACAGDDPAIRIWQVNPNHSQFKQNTLLLPT